MNPSTDSEPFASWLVGFLQLGDTFYPTGAYAHSFGLEGLIAEGVIDSRESLRSFILASVLPALRQSELPLAFHAYAALGAGDWQKVRELSLLSSALKTPRETRDASEAIGMQRSELCARLRGHPLAQELKLRMEREGWRCPSPVAAALEARVLGAPVEAAACSIVYATLSGILAAAMKLIRLGQNGAQSLLTEMLSHTAELIDHASTVPVDEIGWFNPWLDVASARHETADARLFIS